MLCWPPARLRSRRFLMRFLIKLIVPTLLAAVLAAGCGSSGPGVSAGDIAVVGTTHITQGAYDQLLKQQQQSAGSTFPKQGTAEFEAEKSKVVTALVQQAERTQRAESYGIKITDQQVEKKLTALKKQYFGGDQKKYLAQLKKQGLTDAGVHTSIREQLINEALVAHITKDVKVSSDDVHNYYLQHSQLYAKPQSRDIRHVLVKDAQLAQSLYTQLKAGDDKLWCTIAKKYSQDPGSKNNCGKLTVSKGQTVPGFDKVAFSEKTKVVHPPIHDATYGWFVIEPLSIVHPRQTTPEAQVAASIKADLLKQGKDAAITSWIGDLSKSYCGGNKVKYQVGYTPSPDPCAQSTTTGTTTQ
jgi:parvulin-like peptidyl-prolyl isomerase